MASTLVEENRWLEEAGQPPWIREGEVAAVLGRCRLLTIATPGRDTSALHCTVMYWTPLHCTVMYWTPLHCTQPHWTALNSSTLHRSSIHSTIMCYKGWALTFVMRGFRLSKKQSIEVGFAFSNKDLKFQDLRCRMKRKKLYAHFIMFNEFRFGLGLFTTHLTYICLKFLFHIENYTNGVTSA